MEINLKGVETCTFELFIKSSEFYLESKKDDDKKAGLINQISGFGKKPFHVRKERLTWFTKINLFSLSENQ